MQGVHPDGTRSVPFPSTPSPSAYRGVLDEALADVERSRAAAKDALGKLTMKQQHSTTTPEGHDRADLHDFAEDEGETDFFRSRLRQLRTLSFEEKLRLGRGDAFSERLRSARSDGGQGIEAANEQAGPSHCLGTQRRASCPAQEMTSEEPSLAPQSAPSETKAHAEAERASLQLQLSEAQSEIERLSHSMDSLRRNHDVQLSSLRAESDVQARRHAVERESLRSEAVAAVADASRLQRALGEERRRSAELRELSTMQARGGALPKTPQAVAPIIASMELEAFRQADSETRAKLRKKLQLKWHPDKCINSGLAKCVMQELQQRPEW